MHNYGSPADPDYMASRISGIITNKNEKGAVLHRYGSRFFVCLFIELSQRIHTSMLRQ